jgi:hypothetical protein
MGAQRCYGAGHLGADREPPRCKIDFNVKRREPPHCRLPAPPAPDACVDGEAPFEVRGFAAFVAWRF